jgi:hypothetical protein
MDNLESVTFNNTHHRYPENAPPHLQYPCGTTTIIEIKRGLLR